MTQHIGATPLWTVTFDEQGDSDPHTTGSVVDEIVAAGITDLIMFAHGWNNDQATATGLFRRWFSVLEPQLAHAQTQRPRRVGLVSIYWPSTRWRDEEIPDFDPTPSPTRDTAAVTDHPEPAAPVPATREMDKKTLTDLKRVFPTGAKHLDTIAGLLRKPDPDDAVLDRVMAQMSAFEKATRAGASDGESLGDMPTDPRPGMLAGAPGVVFDQFRLGLEDSGMTVSTGIHDTAGLVDSVATTYHGAINGAKEALRSLTYWQMKNRAGVIGQHGLGPLLTRLQGKSPHLRINLVGHSFGARLVSYALAGLPDGLDGEASPVTSVTLLEGAFSHFAFSSRLPFDVSRSGGLAGMQSRINGPLVTSYSSKDSACGRFYPLASKSSGEDSSAVDEADRWGAMGHDGAQAVEGMKSDTLKSVETANYVFSAGGVLSVDASAVVSRGGPPSGAHSDIVHPELTWLVLKAGKVV